VTRADFPKNEVEDLSRVLAQARNQGVKQVEEIAREAALSSAIAQDEIESYLRHAIEYTMTSAHRAGLEEFRRRVLAHGLT
jgi:predicted solute-binding protein